MTENKKFSILIKYENRLFSIERGEKMNSVQIGYFMEVAKYKNFTKAAENLFVSQSSLSKQIASLETELGFSLFTRDNKKVVLTQKGMLMLDFCKNMKNEYEVLMDKVRKIDFTEQSMSMGVQEWMDLNKLGFRNQVREMVNENPEITIEVVTGKPEELMDKLLNGALDVVILVQKTLNIPQLTEAKQLGTTHRSYLIYKENEFFGRKEITFEDLLKYPITIPDYKDNWGEQQAVIKEMNEKGFSGENLILASNFESGMAYVQGGLVATMVDEYMKLFSPEDFQKIDSDEDYHILAVQRRGEKNVFVDTLMEALAEE